MRRLMLYVLLKTIWSFVLAFCALEGMLLITALFGLIDSGERWGITVGTLLKGTPFLLLERATLSIPLAAAAAGAYVFSGMAVSNEIVAVESMGKDARRLMWPLVASGLMLVVLSLMTDEYGKGYGMARIEAMAATDAERLFENRFRSGESIDLGGGGMRYWLTMRAGHDGKPPWVSAMFYRGELLRMAVAGEMTDFRWFKGDEGRGVELKLKNIVGQEPGKGILSLKEGVFVCRLREKAGDVYVRNKAANRSILGNLSKKKALWAEEKIREGNVWTLMTEAGLYSGWSDRPENGVTAGYKWASKELAGLRRQERQADASIHTAMGLALSPIPLLIFGAMLGARVRFRNRASAFLGTVIFVVLVYYPVMMATRGMIETGNSYAGALPYALDGIVLIGAFLGWRRMTEGAG